MTAIQLNTCRVAKPWGRHDLWPGFEDPNREELPIGEIWFQLPEGLSDALLVKYLFTSEKLSVQVHPNDEAAHAAGYARGKDEAWLVLDAAHDSTIAIGTLKSLSADELRQAAENGSIERMLDWKPVKAGDFFYSPARTVHAIGAGITLIEVQQNVDLTYRLYDYGRPRELHLDKAVAVADAIPFEPREQPLCDAQGREILASSSKFVLERWSEGKRHVSLSSDDTGWFVPITGGGIADDVAWSAGDCLALTGRSNVRLDPGATALFSYACGASFIS